MTDLAAASAAYQRGAFAEAEAIGRRMIAAGARGGALSGLIGMAILQQNRSADAVPHLRAALADIPDNLQLRSSLAFALVNSGALDEARRVALGLDAPQLRRIVAFVDQQRGETEKAIAGFRRVLADTPQDFESWTNLGLLLSGAGELDAAIDAFDRSLALAPDAAAYIHRSRALAQGARHQERQASLRSAAVQFPADPALHVELGLAEAAAGDFAAAEAAHRRALAIDPRHAPAYLEYGMLLEALNRLDDMRALIAESRAAGVAEDETAFVEAWLLKREDRFDAALQRAELSAGRVEESRRAQLVGDICDRLGDADRAFGAFAEMNRLASIGPAADYARAQDYPGEIAAATARLTPAAVSGWSSLTAEEARPTPIFILGFPRSGTTLLDTLLMNLPELQIFEEAPMVERVEAMLGDPAALATLSDADARRLRAAYHAEAAAIEPIDGRTIVDKFPLHLVRVPLIHRLFPRAPIVMVERHPCDVVLSCFMARFQTNKAMVQFHTIEGAARLYDVAMTAWTRAAELLPLRVHRLRYEAMVADPEAAMRPLLAFLDLPWRDAVLDSHGSAARRAHIATASYAQVTEPIYARSAYRWHRYRRHLEPVLPILAPWCARMGYAIEPDGV